MEGAGLGVAGGRRPIEGDCPRSLSGRIVTEKEIKRRHPLPAKVRASSSPHPPLQCVHSRRIGIVWAVTHISASKLPGGVLGALLGKISG